LINLSIKFHSIRKAVLISVLHNVGYSSMMTTTICMILALIISKSLLGNKMSISMW
jgi:hypothetical protein